MCGISGMTGHESKTIVRRMLKEISYRGPDFTKIHVGKNHVLGANVLRITGSKGTQPITNEEGSVAAVFNGEIYNHAALRKTLERKGHSFRTDADTEVVVHAYEEWGPNFAKLLDGMFATIIRDQDENRTLLCRDRLGIKPLYYYATPKIKLFSSEIKSLLASGLVEPRINEQALNEFLTMRLTSDEKTLIQNVYRVKPGQTIVFNEQTIKEHYWSFKPVLTSLKKGLKESVEKRTPKDKRSAVLLSGGLDSTIIAHCAKKFNPSLLTFSIIYDSEKDESEQAREAARALNTEHHEVRIPQKLFKKFPELVYLSDEPVSDPVIIPSYALSRAIHKRGIRVVLSGEGADEVFGGYERYKHARLLQAYHSLPFKPLRSLAGMGSNNFFTKRLTKALSKNFSQAFLYRNAAFTDDEKKRILKKKHYKRVDQCFTEQVKSVEDAFEYEVKQFLPKFILTKIDRMGMANHVEARTPFLSHDVVGYGMSLPVSQKAGWLESKKVLRRAFQEELPRRIVRRKKKPFWTPTQDWLGSFMEEWVDHYLSRKKVKEVGLFKPREVRRVRNKSTENYYYCLKTWLVLTIQAWVDKVTEKWGANK